MFKNFPFFSFKSSQRLSSTVLELMQTGLQVCPKHLLQDLCPHLPSACFSYFTHFWHLDGLKSTSTSCIHSLEFPLVQQFVSLTCEHQNYCIMLYFPVRIDDTQYILRLQMSLQTPQNLRVNLLNSAKSSETCVVHFSALLQATLVPEQQHWQCVEEQRAESGLCLCLQ